MSNLPRITPDQAREVERLKALGRTPRQMEKMLGIAHGVLSGRYIVGDDARPYMDRNNNGPSGWRYPAPPEDSTIVRKPAQSPKPEDEA